MGSLSGAADHEAAGILRHLMHDAGISGVAASA